VQYTLKDYQDKAVRSVLSNLVDARDDFHRRQRRSAFALSATTGSGKTVIASAVIETLFRGSDEFGFEPDPSAVVLWVTDDPSLNEQTRHRMIGAADRLAVGQLVTVGNGNGKAPFDQARLEPGHVYFLNIQKFREGSTWIKRSNERTYTLWDTIRNTIQDDASTLYLVLDEAHKGMKRPAARTETGEPRSTIVQRLINGHGDVPPVPVVWGISATIDRFNTAMHEAHAEGRLTYPAVNIDSIKVQESGLLKDTIILDFPEEKGDFETTLLRVAVEQAVEASQLWNTYSKEQGLSEPLLPLLVLQVPNKPSDAELKRYLDVVFDKWPGLPSDAVANVFGEHSDLDIAGYRVPYIQPQDVQDATHIRVLLAKDAVSTGWDCPRAEVLFSLRPASDRTHITQLLGRMVRTPLARRILSDDRLNTVTCYLAHFNQKTAVTVANRLTGKTQADDADTESVVPGRKVLIAPVELRWNPNIGEDVRGFLSTLPSEPKPNAQAKPVKRLLTLAGALARDGLMDKPNESAMSALYQVLDGQLAQHRGAVDKEVEEILTADIFRVTASMVDQSTAEERRQVAADARTVDDAFRIATRGLGAAVANGYVTHLAKKQAHDGEELDLVQARAEVAALVALEGVLTAVDNDAEKITRQWLGKYRVSILALSEERQATYALIRAQARTPEHQDTALTEVLQEESRDEDGRPFETRPLHVLADSAGNYPIGSLANTWEKTVVDTELDRLNVVAWYRNPSHPTGQAIRVPYKAGDEWKSLQPDFIFVTHSGNGDLAASIVDPHSHHLSDALPKLRGLADFAEKYPDRYQRIDSLAKNSAGQIVVLDMLDSMVRQAVRSSNNALGLYDGGLAVAYS
jgi:type III restriction enzyme